MAYVKERLGNMSTLGLIFLMILILFLSIIVAISIGVVSIPYDTIYKILLYNMTRGLISIGDPSILGSGTEFDIIWNIRSPRVFMAAVVGIALAMAGVVMQATVQNPLADPYILGMSSGASFGATFSIAIGAGALFTGTLAYAGIAIWAFLGAFVASILVLGLSSMGGRMTSVKLILSGVIIASLFGAFSNLIVVMAADANEIQTITYWLLGSFGSARWYKITIPLLAVVVCGIYFITQIRSLNTMLMGDETATTLGLDLAKKRKMYVFMTSILTAAAVCFCGVIGFVGLMIPHIVRGITGNNHWKLLPISCILGGIFMIAADILARTVLNGGELPVGIITAVCGTPIFAYIMIKKAYSFS